jgi:hypothetical protein
MGGPATRWGDSCPHPSDARLIAAHAADGLAHADDNDGLVEDLSVRPGECAPCFDGHYRYA